MAISDGELIRVQRTFINDHSAKRSKACGVPHEVVILQKALIAVRSYTLRFNELRLFNGETTPLITFLGYYGILFIGEYFGDLPRCIYSQISISRTHAHVSGISKGNSSSIQRSTPSNFS